MCSPDRIAMTDHAAWRCRQRQVTHQQIMTALEHGDYYRQRKGKRLAVRWRRLVVVLSSSGQIITVWRESKRYKRRRGWA